MENVFFGMHTQEGDDALVPLVEKLKTMYLTVSQIRVALVQFALRNPQFSEAATETVLNEVVKVVRNEVPVEITVTEE